MEHSEEELDAMAEKLHTVKTEIGELFEKHDLDMGEVISLLMSMLVSVGCDSVSPLKLVSALAQGCQAYETIKEASEERGNLQWLN
jgi:hypothetical protein